MSDYPFFIPEVVLCANSSLFWFKVANEHREFRNYLIIPILIDFMKIVKKNSHFGIFANKQHKKFPFRNLYNKKREKFLFRNFSEHKYACIHKPHRF